ncbi:MAG: hypothetical protein A3B23_02850 [Candidatus Colwellbacteria bacterium RIFCSPLOWO2_01_FULL_48_10]|uniref:Uncharacterized protein n=1 Tax=Candidatus Colwellbacteria bacterium RIFCSPLOWO2_01_FULL_48_10 TaxID=1797690 RepID=A0A1G1Z5J8_9BACT|nr:MAG: hypothetical protein A3B23_02850 [Candidatus Colwellbacteria bacterium RIFCSPLOWO2_01_FULL_48_10]
MRKIALLDASKALEKVGDGGCCAEPPEDQASLPAALQDDQVIEERARARIASPLLESAAGHARLPDPPAAPGKLAFEILADFGLEVVFVHEATPIKVLLTDIIIAN